MMERKRKRMVIKPADVFRPNTKFRRKAKAAAAKRAAFEAAKAAAKAKKPAGDP